MARKLRIQYAGAVYHVMNRGDRREAIFHDDQDRRRFLETLGEACAKTGWQVHAYCLMPNHFHLVVETPRPNLVAGMKWFLGTYTSRFNHRHKLIGHLFSGRYKALVMDNSTAGYLKTACDYVHLNPVRAGLLRAEEPLGTYVWSSVPEYSKSAAQRPSWLRVDRLLGAHGIPKDSPAGRRMFQQRMEEKGRAEGKTEACMSMRHGWCLGDEAFRKELLAQVSERRGAHHYGAELQEGEEEKAERLVKAELARRKWSEVELATWSKTDRRKACMALRLRRETTMTLAWIAGRLQMGS
ncbi:MAG: transposase, partial [Verrucomicrobia bacterium]|nr:transposase [Verrucomicrobiota bacterium]